MKKITTISIFVLIIISLTLSSCSSSTSKKLVVAHDVNFPPFEFLQDDKYVGFDLDLMAEIAKIAKLDLEYRPMDFNGIIPALQANQVDMAIAAMTIKPEREEVIDFSIPYFRTGLVLAVKPDNNEIVNPEDLKGKTIAVKIGTSGEAYIRELPYADEIKIDTYDSNNDAYMAVINGNAVATINDDSTLKYYIAEQPDTLKIVGELLTGDNYGISVPDGKTDLLQKINDALLEIAKNGTYDQLYEKWFGVKPDVRPGEFK